MQVRKTSNMSCQKTFAAYHHLNLELVSFSVFNALLPSRSGRQKLAVCQEPKNSFFKYHFKKSQCMLILAARSKVYSDCLLCGCTTSTKLIIADRDVDQKMQVIKASFIEHVMKYLQHIQTFASLIPYSIQLFINIFLRKVRLEYGRKVVLEELSHHFM